jgi:hemolysin III
MLATWQPSLIRRQSSLLQAIVYALKRPDPVPHIFGYHEVFHTFVTVAALLHFAAV